MTDRRILTLRCILLTALPLAAVWWPEAAWLVCPLLFMPSSILAPPSACPTHCTIEANSVSVTFAGVVVGDGAGACDPCVSNPFNSTFVIPRTGPCNGIISLGQNCETGRYDLVRWGFGLYAGFDGDLFVEAIAGAAAETLPTSTREFATFRQTLSEPIADCRALGTLTPTLIGGFNCASGLSAAPQSVINFNAATCTAVPS